MMFTRSRWWLIPVIALGIGALFAPVAAAAQRLPSSPVALAYVLNDSVTLADGEGKPLETTGPTFTFGQGARLFWSPDGEMLYIARDDGLYVTGAQGGAAALLPGYYGRTVAISQDGEHLYYMETVSPQDLDEPGFVSFPMREVVMALMDGGAGRLDGYFGRYRKDSAKADLTFAAALYARDGGLLGVGRPTIWPTYGSNLLATCCFPEPGIAAFDTATGSTIPYDDTFIPGAAAVNMTRTHLAGPTTGGAIRIYDLITGGSRDYVIEIAGGMGTIERVAWSPDSSMLYIISRYDPKTPLQMNARPLYPVDTRSANITLYRLNLVTGVIRELAWREDVYGVSSLTATDRYVFAVVVESNARLINAINEGTASVNVPAHDPSLLPYMPTTRLWRVNADGGGAADIQNNVWGVVARPIR